MYSASSLILLIIFVLVGSGAERHPATMALIDLWEAAGNGSSQDILCSLESRTAAGILDICDEYLQDLRSLSHLELSLLFAVMRIEASPGEVTNWDSRTVLETILSAPNHAYFFSNTVLQIDSLHESDSAAVVFFTLLDPYGHSNSIGLPASMTENGWKLTGLDTLLTSAIEGSFYN